MRHEAAAYVRVGVAVRAFAFLFMFAFASRAHAADSQDCPPLVSLATLEMRTLPDGRISIPVKIQDRDLFFMVDTGGINSSVDPGLAAGMGLHKYEARIPLIGINSTRLDRYVVPQNFAIGPLKNSNFWFYVETSGLDEGWGGVIAPELLRSYDVDFDFAGGKLNLISPNHCPGRVVYWTHDPVAVVEMTIDEGGHIVVPVTINGKVLRAFLDTGAETSFMSMSVATRFLGVDETSAGMKSNTRNFGKTVMKTYTYPFKALSLEGLSVNNPNIEIFQNRNMVGFGSEMTLGVGILRQLHMYIAYQEGKLYLTAARAH